MKLIPIFILLSIVVHGQSWRKMQSGLLSQFDNIDYFVSSTGGGDTLTLSELNSTTLSAGDVVAFRSGDTFEGTLTVGQSGTSGNPIKFTSYGTGAKPKIYGSEVITGWTVHSGNIWKATLTNDITQVFVNGEKMTLARHTNAAYDTITGVTSSTVFTISGLNGSVSNDYYDGISVITRTEAWFSVAKIVTASTNNTLTINSAPPTALEVGQNVLLTNHLDFLDEAGEWYYDNATNILYLWTPNGDSPVNYEVRGSVFDYGVNIGVNSHITVKDLEILQQKERGISIAGVGNPVNVNIINNKISGQPIGIYALPTTLTDYNFSHNEIFNVTDYGIYGYNLAGATSYNTIYNIGEFDTWGLQTVNGDAINISLGSATGTNTINYNDIENTAYNGIMWRGEAQISYNYIKDVCQWKNDGGGIYTGSPTADGSIVSYNIVDGIFGNTLGYPAMSRSISVGIYIDEGAVGVEVANNTVLNSDNSGIFLHRPNNHNIHDNTVFHARTGIAASNTLLVASEGATNIDSNLVITDSNSDDYFPRQLFATIYANTLADGVNYDYNQYISGFGNDNLFRSESDVYIDFAAWQTHVSGEANSSYDGTVFEDNEVQNVIYNNTISEKTYYLNNASNVKDHNGDSIINSFVLQPYTSKYVRGVDIDCILEYEDIIAPEIIAFVLPDTIEELTVTPTILTSTGNATAYFLAETDTTPDLYSTGWSLAPTYTFTESGTKDLYVYARDSAGNTSLSATDSVVVNISYPIDNADIIHVWQFNETSGTTVSDAVGSNAGTATETTIVDGKFNKAREFDGIDDYVSISVPSVINSGMTDDFSLITWIKPAATTSYRRFIEIVGNSTNILSIATTGAGRLNAQIKKNGTNYIVGDDNAVNTSDYMFIVVTWDASENDINLYVDNISKSHIGEALGTSASGGARFGGRADGGSFTNVIIDETLIIDRIITPTEISELYNSGNGIEYFLI